MSRFTNKDRRIAIN